MRKSKLYRHITYRSVRYQHRCVPIGMPRSRAWWLSVLMQRRHTCVNLEACVTSSPEQVECPNIDGSWHETVSRKAKIECGARNFHAFTRMRYSIRIVLPARHSRQQHGLWPVSAYFVALCCMSGIARYFLIYCFFSHHTFRSLETKQREFETNEQTTTFETL